MSHRDYGKAPGNIYHVGCVTSVNPLRIVHATPPNAKVDTAIGKWAYWGLLKEVEYGSVESGGTLEAEAPETPAAPTAQEEPGQGQAIALVTGLRMRRLPGKEGAAFKTLPMGTIVKVLRVEGDWAEVRWDVTDKLRHIGWCCIGEDGKEYLRLG